MDELLTRALSAYFRKGGIDQPSFSSSGLEKIAEKEYVVLRNAKGVLAVYG